eukprot:764151-Hanusia_phi.AAC.5
MQGSKAHAPPSSRNETKSKCLRLRWKLLGIPLAALPTLRQSCYIRLTITGSGNLAATTATSSHRNAALESPLSVVPLP